MKFPYIPTKKENRPINCSSWKKTACFCQLLKETGARCGEIAELDWLSIDWEQRKVRIKGEKGSNSRIDRYPLKLLKWFQGSQNQQITRKRKNKIFANADDMRTNFFLQKRRIIERQANPKLILIHFPHFQTLEATTEQHKTKDPGMLK